MWGDGYIRSTVMAVEHAGIICLLVHLVYIFRLYFPKQWYTEGFWRLGKDIHGRAGSSPAPVARQLLCTGCGLGKGQVALVHAKHSLASLSSENTYRK